MNKSLNMLSQKFNQLIQEFSQEYEEKKNINQFTNPNPDIDSDKMLKEELLNKYRNKIYSILETQTDETIDILYNNCIQHDIYRNN